MAVDLRGRLLVLLKVRLVCKGCYVLNQDLLRTSRFEMHLFDQRKQFLPSLAVRTSTLSRVQSCQLPSLTAGKNTDGTLQFDGSLVQGAGGSWATAPLPKVRAELMVPIFQASLFQQQVLEIGW